MRIEESTDLSDDSSYTIGTIKTSYQLPIASFTVLMRKLNKNLCEDAILQRNIFRNLSSIDWSVRTWAFKLTNCFKNVYIKLNEGNMPNQAYERLTTSNSNTLSWLKWRNFSDDKWERDLVLELRKHFALILILCLLLLFLPLITYAFTNTHRGKCTKFCDCLVLMCFSEAISFILYLNGCCYEIP